MQQSQRRQQQRLRAPCLALPVLPPLPQQRSSLCACSSSWRPAGRRCEGGLQDVAVWTVLCTVAFVGKCRKTAVCALGRPSRLLTQAPIANSCVLTWLLSDASVCIHVSSSCDTLTLSRMQVTNLEKRLALVEGREAAVVSQLRTAEAAAAEGESAAAENASLREQLRELKRDRSHLEQHKMVGFMGTQPNIGLPFRLMCMP